MVEYWKTAKAYDIGTMQNKITALRHIMKEAGNTLYKINNSELGIGSGRDILNLRNLDKSYFLSQKARDFINNRPIEVQAAIKLMQSYGFRKDEALKATWAMVHGRNIITKNGKIYLMPAWTKNGNYREFEMHDRGAAVKEIKELVKNYKITGNIQQTRGLIDRTFTSLKKIDGDQAHPHGLRHEYAHFRYYQITGMTAPAAGGLKYAEMDANQRKLYHNACKIIAVELGHSRETISRAYVGK
ncbi:MAG: integrase domain-containing protein [Deltaproteobacteria bacterium]|nr:integrase domain-containing protein [Deltaproteobacteria bacterium]